jgi:hypothetical protein
MRSTLIAALLLATTAAAASAQDPLPEDLPIGRFAADVRAAMPRFKQDPNIAAGIGVTAPNLPTRGTGLVIGAHVYPFRLRGVTFGFGGEILTSRAGRTLDATTADGPEGPTVKTRFSALSPQMSFNFGRRRGWSYISGGLGWSRFTVEEETAPQADAEARTFTINYGGGARWFAKDHLAVCFDVRLYAVRPQEATATRPAYPRMTLMVLSVGASFK